MSPIEYASGWAATRPRHRARCPAGTALIGGLALLSGCGGESRSVEAYCDSARRQLEDLRQKYSDRTTAAEAADPLTGLAIGIASLAEGQGDIAVFFRRLADVAPEEIRVDVEVVAEGFQQQADRVADAASDPLGGLVGGLLGGLQLQGPYDRVADYTDSNCGVSL